MKKIITTKSNRITERWYISNAILGNSSLLHSVEAKFHRLVISKGFNRTNILNVKVTTYKPHRYDKKLKLTVVAYDGYATFEDTNGDKYTFCPKGLKQVFGMNRPEVFYINITESK